MLNGFFIDDEDLSYAKMLTTRGVLVFEGRKTGPLTQLAKTIFSAQPSIVALDYRLDEDPGEMDPADTYKASVLAQKLRDDAIDLPTKDFPIVLVSNEPQLDALYRPDKTAHDLFDRVYGKRFILNNRAQVRAEVISLAKGYQLLAAVNGNYDLASLLGLAADDKPLLDHQELQVAAKSAAAPHILARVILRNLILRPGLLIDDSDAAARLGIEEPSFQGIAGRIEGDASYKGVFAGGGRRWWTHKLVAWGEQILGTRITSLTAAQRAEALSVALEAPLAPAASTWDGSVDQLVAMACASCRLGTDISHSVTAFDPHLPRYALRKRICWNCVQTDRYKAQTPPLLIDETDQRVATRVLGLKRPPKVSGAA
ncbi:hypothetical protein SAMN05444678_10722 [Sphingomonas sp. YR710]|uniref:hypothetical protein n=1 Tax=Sphingomonas sp. YR710 TaxID=1882773 RepID=UPI00088A1DFE|nr:hypothetical protein [Sphingomonas sp. YR710]SDC93111.1 hypothetical protein SAMN05444678_10722 [Sphingomonas sp. YR710]